MLKFGTMATMIRIQSPTPGTNDNGFPDPTWTDILDEDIPCEWKNKFGGEVYQAAAVQAKEPASLKLWYIPGVTQDCRVVRVEDEAVFEIINVDDVMNRHQQLEVEVRRFTSG
jgi:head-tail adaptor